MKKKAKVLSCEPWVNGKPDSHGNVMHDISFDNGDVGVHNTKPQNAFKVGEEVEYDIEDAVWSKSKKPYKKIRKPKKENYSGGGGGGKSTFNTPMNVKGRAISTAQNAAIDIYLMFEKKVSSRKDLFDLSSAFYHWITKIDLEADTVGPRQGSLMRAVKLYQLQGDDLIKITRESQFFNKEVIDFVIRTADILLANAQTVIETPNINVPNY